jgi:hypothetical protein
MIRLAVCQYLSEKVVFGNEVVRKIIEGYNQIMLSFRIFTEG